MCEIGQLIGLLQGPLVLYYPQHSVDHGIQPFAHVLLRVNRGHMDLQLLTNGEEAVEYILKTVQYTTKPASSLGLESMLCCESDYSAARYAVDSYRSGQGSASRSWTIRARSNQFYWSNLCSNMWFCG